MSDADTEHMDVISNNVTFPPPQRDVWLIGDSSHSEFREAVGELHASARVLPMADLQQVRQLPLPSLPPPGMIVVLQPRPGAVTPSAISQLSLLAPQAEVIVLLGSWCEGERRADRLTTGIWRILWHEFLPWWRARLTDASREPLVVQPDRLPVQAKTPPERESRGLIVVDTPWRATAEALCDGLHAAGFATLWLARGRRVPMFGGVTAGVWDGGQLDERETSDLVEFQRHMVQDHAPTIALLDFPRRDRCDVAREVGAAAVLGKPVNLEQLVALLDECSGKRRQPAWEPIEKAA